MHQLECTNAPMHQRLTPDCNLATCTAVQRIDVGRLRTSMHYNQEVLGRALVCVHENFQNPQWLCQNRSRRFVLHSRIKCLPLSVFAPWPDCRRCSNPTEGGNRTPSHSRYAVVLQSQLCGCVRQRMLSATLFCCRSHVHRNASRVYPYRGRSRSRQSTRRRHSRSREHSRRRHGRRSRCASRNGSPRHHSGI